MVIAAIKSHKMRVGCPGSHIWCTPLFRGAISVKLELITVDSQAWECRVKYETHPYTWRARGDQERGR